MRGALRSLAPGCSASISRWLQERNRARSSWNKLQLLSMATVCSLAKRRSLGLLAPALLLLLSSNPTNAQSPSASRVGSKVMSDFNTSPTTSCWMPRMLLPRLYTLRRPTARCARQSSIWCCWARARSLALRSRWTRRCAVTWTA